MFLRLLVLFAAAVAGAFGQYGTSYARSSVSYGSSPAYQPKPSYQKPSPSYTSYTPACSKKTTKPWCLEDEEYPTYNITQAANYHSEKLLSLYADVNDLSTKLSVDRPKGLQEETYVCKTATSYVKPLRIQNTDGHWRIIVNNIDLYHQRLTQTTRIEECQAPGDVCRKVPDCYNSKCLQKSVYHRFLVYDPYDEYFPFVIESFKLPASCDCLLGASTLEH
ncbi:uncharacterized protein LOC135220150 [Macrobrachium nipponense]|uniref:uncharacterized protein LOC135220150 n=1 Tax=Macrobrachium nipponense TaxID=159736 RepID=UPI0030C8592C